MYVKNLGADTQRLLVTRNILRKLAVRVSLTLSRVLASPRNVKTIMSGSLQCNSRAHIASFHYAASLISVCSVQE